MPLTNCQNNKNAFSLIEVLIFVSILSVFLVAVSTITIGSLRNMKINEHRILADYYGEQLIEWIRDQKEIDWEEFLTHEGAHCFNDETLEWGDSCAADLYLATIFKRNANISIVNPDQVNINVILSWTELGKSYQVPFATVFTRWED